ncbi:hypothetical protein NCAS_0B03710 [Naumovozyma castellii]|uniref:AB hydrolase-1 domain-containing protein n=1 Tax=Naumovozyma castellii TaxID=27288 RepID=G0VBX8_NAUCA|nr:hypothetical protein NCAS_0B03710 [Naumovozyma castellii CBS 4309]CCC68455.1 hypothetical protein NCAS_0B03710 [Naumovozyma castellii CBS 4309]
MYHVPGKQCIRLLHVTQAISRERSLEARIISRVLLSPDQANGATQKRVSTLKLWLSVLKKSYDPERCLAEKQNELMENIHVAGTKENTMIDGVLNQWSFHNSSATAVTTPTLLLHGYAASSLCFFRTFVPLSRSIKNLYATDLPGNGLSKNKSFFSVMYGNEYMKVKYEENNKFSIKYLNSLKDQTNSIKHSEDYYIDAIREWQLSNNLPKINLVGHSFGGYLSFKYALRYPDNVNKLCLVSPLGVESNLYSVNNSLKENYLYDVDYSDPKSSYYSRNFAIPKSLFEGQFGILRWMGPIGARVCWNYILSSYKRVPSMKYKEYLFHLLFGNAKKLVTSAKTFTNLFTRNLLAKDPIMDSIEKLQCEKLMVMYGQHDWMNKYAGYCLIAKLNNYRSTKDAGYFTEIPEAGHNLILDNPDRFSSSLISFLSK